MYNGGYSQKRSTNSLGLGIIVAGHAVLPTAIALNPTKFGPRINFIPKVDSIRAEKPPEPEKLPPPKREKTETAPQKVDTLIKTAVPVGGGTIALELPRVDPGPTILAPLQIEPVFRQAAMDPKAMGRFQPPYPSSMIRAGLDGSVTVKVLIGTDGRVRQIELVSATRPDFFESTRDHALRAWRFQPATRDGIATESWRTMTVKFLLES